MYNPLLLHATLQPEGCYSVKIHKLTPDLQVLLDGEKESTVHIYNSTCFILRLVVKHVKFFSLI